MYGFFTKDGSIHTLYKHLVATEILIEFPTILDRFFINVAISQVAEDGSGGTGKR